MSFEVILRNNKVRQYNSMMLFIVLLSVAVFILTSFYSDEKFVRSTSLTGAGLVLLAMAIDIFFRKQGKVIPRLQNLPLLIASMTWAVAGNYWGFLLSILLLGLFGIAQRQLSVLVDNKFVRYPSFPRRTIGWNELNNVILKDGLLTIDFKNDKILQSEITEASSAVNEQEFNEFCREQLKV